MKKIFSKKNGITIIALIITIILLIILAGIGISMLLGDNGILNKAKMAKENSENSNKVEIDKISKYNDILDSYVTTSRASLDENAVKNLIQEEISWKYLGTTTGTAAIALPSTYNEIIIRIKLTNGVNYSFSFAREELTDTSELYYNGFNNGNSNTCRVQISRQNASIYQIDLNGSNVTTTTVAYYYYR